MKTGIELINEINSCKLEKETAAFWWLGQMGFAVKLDEKIIYIDLFLSEIGNRRNIEPLIKPEEITNADYIFGTHDHTDHIDRAVWHQISLSSPKAKFIVPDLLVDSLSEDLNIPKERFIGLDDGVSLDIQDFKISGVASAHEFLDRDPITGKYPYLGYVIEYKDFILYHSGDTCIYEGMQTKLKKWDKIDLMFIPINGRDAKRYSNNIIGNMTYQEAVDLAGAIKPGLVVPAHYEMFDMNSADPNLFADYLNIKYEGVKHWIGRHGEKIIVKK
jgi:L-ascorbate metabolism protein UlaG (beta-lactamase superfamily)